MILEELSLTECNEFWNAEQDRVSAIDFNVFYVHNELTTYML